MTKLNPQVESNVAALIVELTNRVVNLQGTLSPYITERYFDIVPDVAGDEAAVKLRVTFTHDNSDDAGIPTLESQLKDNLSALFATCGNLAIDRQLTLGGGGTTSANANYVVGAEE